MYCRGCNTSYKPEEIINYLNEDILEQLGDIPCDRI